MARISDEIITAYEDPGPWSAWIYGDYGTGKTVFAASFPNTLILDTERSRRSLLNHPEVSTRPIIKVRNFEHFKNICQQIIAQVNEEWLQNIETIVIDTLSTLQMKELNEQMKTVGQRQGRHPDLPSEGEFNINNTRIRKAILELMERSEKNIIILSHIKEEKDGDTTILIRPGNSPSLSQTIASLVDGIFYLSAKTDSKGVFSQKLQCIPSPKVRAKNRFSATLSREIENPIPQNILDAIQQQKDLITEYLNTQKENGNA